MKNTLKLFLLIVTFYAYAAYNYAQDKIQYNEKNYKSEFDSLKYLKEQNENSKKNLINEINELKKISTDLNNQIMLITQEIEKLYVDKFGKEIGLRVYNKQIWKGMTEKMLSASWGKPDKIDKNVEKWGTFTQWYYGKITFFLSDGKLTDWEELK
ncbi:MAG: hypothetical protein KGZ42_01435 [Melioribacter sp.]|nr:hypothetical protein [Melioribacter sp.]